MTEQFSATKVHPRTLKPTRCVVTKFDTGHMFTRFSDGHESFTTKRGTALSKKSGTTLIPRMKTLANNL